jgi:zinc protease
MTLVRPLAALALATAIAASPAASQDAPFETVVLDNGLTLLLAPSDAHPVIALSCYVATGGRTEDEYYQGSLHYIEHLVYKGGTPNLAPTEFRKRMSLLGQESGGWTWDDEINFGFEVPKENFAEAMPTFREALLDLQFEEEWFEDEKRVVLQEMSRGREQPDQLVYEAWTETAYDVHPYRRSVIGTEKAILELDMNRTYEYYRERFTPNHMILSIAGDFDPAEMVEWVKQEWGGLERGPESFELGLVEPDQLGPRRRVDHRPQASTALLLTGARTPGGLHEDTPALEMLAELMNDRSYGLPQYLSEQHKWVVDVSASHYAKRDAGDFQILARCEPANHAAIAEFIPAFLLDFDATAIPDDVFEQARRELLFSEASQRAAAADRAGRFGFLVSRRGREGARTLTERYRTLTAEEVQAAKERWIGPRRLVTVSVLPDDWEDSSGTTDRVSPAAPAAVPVPDLDVAGALMPAPGTPLAYEKVEEADGVSAYRFANGMRLLVRPTSASPLVGVTGRVLGGQWVEPVGQEGINVFVSELGMRRTRRWDREGFNRLLASRSVRASAHMSTGSRANTSRHQHYRDAAGHHYVALTEEWPTTLACLKETLFFPAFRSGEVDKLRDDLITRAKLLPENNLEYIKQEFYDAVYEGHPYGRETYGTEASLAGLGASELESFHRETWTPDRIVVSLVGNVDPDEVAAWISTRWADVVAPEGDPFVIDGGVPAVAWDPPVDRQVLDLGKDYWTVNWGRPGALSGSPDADASAVLSGIAGSDHFYKYVYGEGVSYRSWIRYWEQLGPGTWIVENDVKRERFDEILAMFDEDLTRYSTEGFPRQEFDDAVQRLVNTEVLSSQDNALLAFRLAVSEGNGAGFRHVTDSVARLRGVSYEDIQRLAAEVFAPEGILRMVQQ